MIVSTATARRGITSGRYLVRQYGDDGQQYADLRRIPRTRQERDRAPVTSGDGLRGRDGVRYLALDDCQHGRVDHVAVNW